MSPSYDQMVFAKRRSPAWLSVACSSHAYQLESSSNVQGRGLFLAAETWWRQACREVQMRIPGGPRTEIRGCRR